MMSKTHFSPSLLQHKTAVVTGAGKGIGRQIALQLSQTGALVIAVARTKADLLSLQQQCPNPVEIVALDASSEDFQHYLKHQKIDILVNNLGTNRPAPFIDISEQDFDWVNTMNVRTVFFNTQTVVRSMLKHKIQGSIINISSQMGHIGSPNRSVYCATKHALEGLSKALAVELAPNGIRVNSVAPTFVKTALTEPMLEDPVFHDFVMSKIPMKKLATESEVANAVIFLASSLSNSTTGSCLKVDGGWTAE